MTAPLSRDVVVRRSRLAAAAIIPPVAWFGYQQGLSIVLRESCALAGAPTGPLLGAGALLACAVAAWLAGPDRDPLPNRGRHLAARLARYGAGMFALAIAFQMLATLLVPPCVA